MPKGTEKQEISLRHYVHNNIITNDQEAMSNRRSNATFRNSLKKYKFNVCKFFYWVPQSVKNEKHPIKNGHHNYGTINNVGAGVVPCVTLKNQ